MQNKTKTNIFKNLIWIINYILKVDSKYMFISLLSAIIGGLIPPLSLIMMQEIINMIQLKNGINNVFFYIVIYLGIDLLQNIYNNFVSYYNSKFSMKFSLELSESILTKASKLSLSDYENSKTYDLINRAQNEGGTKLLTYFTDFVSIVTQIITLFSYLIILLTFKYWIVLIIAIMPIIKYIANNKYNLISFKISRERTNDYRRSWYINYLLTYGNFFKELKTFNLFNYFIDKYRGYIKKFNKQDLEITKSRIVIFSILSIIETIIDGLIFTYTVFLGLNGSILIGNVITYTRTITGSKSYITSILLNISNIIRESLFIDQLFEYFDLPEINNEEKITIDEIKTIEIKDLYFKYPNSKEYSLKNINLTIKNSEKIALLGINGSGKTTLVKIIMGFYSDYEGDVFINGINLKDINKASLLSRISTLFQDFVRYEATIRENIAYSNLNIMNSDNVLNEIANKFKLSEIIDTNTNGLDTQLGMWFDEGKNLSMGQWQRVALSRAFAKDSDLYILDEPNAAMDLITEYKISKLYGEILQDKIGIIIAHKIGNIIKVVDRIIVIDNGEIIEDGNHEKLLINKGLYATLYSYNN